MLEQILIGVSLVAFLAAAVLLAAGLAYRRRTAERVSHYVLALGFVSLTGAIATRWIVGSRPPLSDLYETLVFLSWCTALLFILTERFYKITAAGLILVPASFFLLAVAAVIYQGPQPLINELQSFWLTIHVGVSLLGYAAFALAFATGFFYVIQEDLIRKKYQQVRHLILSLVVATGTALGAYVGYLIAHPLLFEDASGHRVYAYSRADWTIIIVGALVGLGGSLILGWAAARGAARPSFANRLPALSLLDRLSYRSVLLGLGLLAVSIATGSIWAHQAWGQWWVWDPKETWSVIAFAFYAGYLGLREWANWRGRHSAMLAIAGLFIILFTFLGVKLLVPGQHDFN
jgi:cytochrome c-type biogenesis protein CcsB